MSRCGRITRFGKVRCAYEGFKQITERDYFGEDAEKEQRQIYSVDRVNKHHSYIDYNRVLDFIRYLEQAKDLLFFYCLKMDENRLFSLSCSLRVPIIIRA